MYNLSIMISLFLKNAFCVSEDLETSFFHFKDQLPTVFDAFARRGQGFYKAIDDTDTIAQLHAFCKNCEGRYEDIVVLGIGGSALGMKTLRDALGQPNTTPRMHILDNVDPDFIADIDRQISLPRTLFLVISKSGGTTETMTQYFYFQEKIRQLGLSIEHHFVFITGQESLLHQLGKNLKIPCFFVPDDVGGRFSVLTPVGLLPARLMGIDIDRVLVGARAMRDRFVSMDADINWPFQLAVLQHLFVQKNCTNQVLMPYSNKLKTFAEWGVQLIGESTGKIRPDGASVGVTPLVALGATDQHSQLQLYSDGPADKCIFFLTVENFSQDISIPVPAEVPSFAFIQGVTFAQLLNTEMKGTADALTERKRPNLEIRISQISEENMGGLFLLFEGMTAFLGELLGINAFDQPGVERSKILTKAYLQQKERT